jgi:hypothetical protein
MQLASRTREVALVPHCLFLAGNHRDCASFPDAVILRTEILGPDRVIDLVNDIDYDFVSRVD